MGEVTIDGGMAINLWCLLYACKAEAEAEHMDQVQVLGGFGDRDALDAARQARRQALKACTDYLN